MSAREVVITGVGPVCAWGAGAADALAALRDPEPLVQPTVRFDALDPNLRLGEVLELDSEPYLVGTKTYLDRASEMALVALGLALEHAGLDVRACDMARTGLSLGTAFGGLETMTRFHEDVLTKGPRFAKPFLFPHTYANTAASLAAIDYGLTGYHNSFAAGGVSSALALLDAVDRIAADEADVMLAGGYDALSEALLTGLQAAGRLAEVDPEEDACCRPYAEPPVGLFAGEGAAVLVLESRAHAAARGARVLARVAGGDARTDADLLWSRVGASLAPDRCGLLAAADGSACDAREAAILARLGARRPACVSGLAPILGQTFGAASALQVATAALVLDAGDLALPPFFGAADAVVGAAAGDPPAGMLCAAMDPGGMLALLAIARDAGNGA